MRTRPLGSTGLEVSELGLGTWGLSGDGYGPVPESDQDKVIERALLLGITLFETADSYAHGDMERRLGRLLPKDKGVVVVTKLGTDREASPARKRFDVPYLERALDASRERLQQDALDVALLHNPSHKALQGEGLPAFFTRSKGAGKLKAWGVSTPDLEVARAAIHHGADVLETPYNAFTTQTVTQLSPLLEEKKVGLLAHSVLAYGLLAGGWTSDNKFPPGDHRSDRWTPDELRARVRQLRALRPAVQGPVHSLRAVALRFVLSNPRVGAAVLGPRSAIQLDQLVREAGSEAPYLGPEVLTALKARLSDAGVPR